MIAKRGAAVPDARQHHLSAAFLQQAAACDGLGAPFTAQVLAVLADLWPSAGPLLRARLMGWQGDLGPSGQSVPLRLAGGMHALVRAGLAPGLAAVYPPSFGDKGALQGAVQGALQQSDGYLCAFMDQPPQTNEVGRSAVLLAVAAVLSNAYRLPLRLSELGASAGLNLWFDRYALDTGQGRMGDAASPLVLRPQWWGAHPKPARITIDSRAGCDLTPIDPATQGARLAAYVWPDQPERLARLQLAMGLAGKAVIDQADAADWLEKRLCAPWEGCCHLVYHTVAFQYFPPAVQARIGAALAAAGARASQTAPLAWFAMEADDQGEGAALTLHIWPNHRRIALGRAGFHGQWVDWRGGDLPAAAAP